MVSTLPETEKWLTLSQAAAELNIHPTTLRRWADNGDIPFMLTPGGHRRFAHNDIRAFSESRRRLRNVSDLEEIWAQTAITRTHQELLNQENQPWLTISNDDDRNYHRALGRRLMGLTLQYVSNPELNGKLLEEARAVGLEYGRISKARNLPLTDAIQAAMFFRDTLIEVALQLPESAGIKPEANVQLMRRINQLLNTVHLAIAEVYDQHYEKTDIVSGT